MRKLNKRLTLCDDENDVAISRISKYLKRTLTLKRNCLQLNRYISIIFLHRSVIHF